MNTFEQYIRKQPALTKYCTPKLLGGAVHFSEWFLEYGILVIVIHHVGLGDQH